MFLGCVFLDFDLDFLVFLDLETELLGRLGKLLEFMRYCLEEDREEDLLDTPSSATFLTILFYWADDPPDFLDLRALEGLESFLGISTFC